MTSSVAVLPSARASEHDSTFSGATIFVAQIFVPPIVAGRMRRIDFSIDTGIR